VAVFSAASGKLIVPRRDGHAVSGAVAAPVAASGKLIAPCSDGHVGSGAVAAPSAASCAPSAWSKSFSWCPRRRTWRGRTCGLAGARSLARPLPRANKWTSTTLLPCRRA